MRGILMGAIGGAGKGMTQNAQAAMAEESKMRMTRELAQMEEQIRAEREAAIQARREKVLGSTTDPAEIQRQGVVLGDKELTQFGRQQIEDTRSDERYATEQGWKEKDYGLREEQQRDSSARGWASVNAQNARYAREDDKTAREDAKRQLYGIYLDSVAGGNKDDAEAARREGMREFGVDFAAESRGKANSYADVVGVGNTYQRLYSDLLTRADKTYNKEEKARLLAEAEEVRRKAMSATDYVAGQVGIEPARSSSGTRRPLSEILK